MSVTLILGSGPAAPETRAWDCAPFDRLLAINNAWAVRPDWDELIHPWDFPPDRRPLPGPGQRLVTEDDFVPAQNRWGGFVYAGGTMAFTAGYWALDSHDAGVLAFFGCDMHYPRGRTHFYGQGRADPLRADLTLQSLEAKAARLMVLAARAGVACVNLSTGPSRLVFPRRAPAEAARARPALFDATAAAEAEAEETRLGYVCPSGRYWEEAGHYDPAALRAVDALWLRAAAPARGRVLRWPGWRPLRARRNVAR